MRKILLFFVALILAVSFVSAAGTVVITPSSPTENDALTASVQGYEDTTFDFYWMKDGATYYTSEGTSSTLSASKTNSGDVWTVSVWVPASAGYDSYEYGSKTVTVVNSESSGSENHAPLARDISFTVTEGDLIDVDLVQYNSYASYISSLKNRFTNGQDVPAYDSDGDVLQIGYNSLLDADGQWQTAVGDAGSYTVFAKVYDGDVSTDVTIDITVKEASSTDNHAPQATNIHFTVTEGDLIDVNMKQDSAFFVFINDRVKTSISQSETLYSYDSDGDALTISFSPTYLDSNGQWQTQAGDAGVYSTTALVSDGTVSTTANIKITVLAGACADSDGDGICDVDECTDSDGDGICDVDECTDSDADGICDVDECTDSDGDGICDVDECTDSDGDGICDVDECTDSDGDGICDVDECTDSDG
ncbi:hypothetical protein HZA98_01235, partial [Candidatus Woesearchaeota archaeon]|nr:hypothetical protein [Candidatus Woesearchaeota archaeon]